MRYRAIQEGDRRDPIRLMCRALSVSPAGYDAWGSRPESDRSMHNRARLSEIQMIHRASRETSGRPSLGAALITRGPGVGEHRIARLLRVAGLRAKTVKQGRGTTDSAPLWPVATNTLTRQCQGAQPNRGWAGDRTSVWTTAGWLYRAVILDLYSRLVIGWAMGQRVTGELAEHARLLALATRQPHAGLLHHSDRGSHYAATRYQHRLTTPGITPSMSRRGNCGDTACVERVFGTLTRERVPPRHSATRDEAKQDIFESLEVFYHRRRRHSTLDYDSPAEFEARTAVAEPGVHGIGERSLFAAFDLLNTLARSKERELQ